MARRSRSSRPRRGMGSTSLPAAQTFVPRMRQPRRRYGGAAPAEFSPHLEIGGSSAPGTSGDARPTARARARRRVSGRDVADVLREAVRGIERVEARISRSRVTFATIEAAAIAALFSSPSTTAVCSGADGPSRKPSTRQASAGGKALQHRAQTGEVRAVQAVAVDVAGGIARTTTFSAHASTAR